MLRKIVKVIMRGIVRENVPGIVSITMIQKQTKSLTSWYVLCNQFLHIHKIYNIITY